MKNNTTKEIVVSSALMTLTILLLNPFHFWMPDTLVMGLLATLLVCLGIFSSFILREETLDERDSAHRTLAGRNAFLAGSAILVFGIIVQGYAHSIDAWLISTLVVMIIVKIATRIWSDKNF